MALALSIVTRLPRLALSDIKARPKKPTPPPANDNALSLSLDLVSGGFAL